MSSIIRKLDYVQVNIPDDIYDQIIQTTCLQLKNTIRIHYLNAVQNQKSAKDREKEWWENQVRKWQSIWETLKSITNDLTEFDNITDLEHLAESLFMEYEQMHNETYQLNICVKLKVLKDEARKWRNTGVYVALIQRQCVVNSLAEVQSNL